MKKALCILFAVVMIVSMFGCQQTMQDQSTTTGLSTQPTTPPEQVKNYPLVSGTFMQPWAFAGYSLEQLVTHMQYLKAVGIELLIVQSTMNTTDQIHQVCFRGSFDDAVKAEDFEDTQQDFLGNVLEAAKVCGMEVFVGLANDGAWWSKVFSDQQWLDDHLELSMLGAKQIYDNYKKDYADTLTGWYFWPEYWNMDLSVTAAATDFLSRYRDGLYAIDPNMPMLLSPFLSSGGTAPEQTGKFWTDVLSGSTLRSGDIFCCQDSVGAGYMQLDQIDAYFAAMKAAADTKEGLLFWANNEDFTPNFKSADMGRFVQQLEITHKYTDTHISFAFCHYRNPDVGKQKSYDAYKLYYETGALIQRYADCPDVQVTSEGQGRYVHFTVTADNAGGDLCQIIITKDGQVVFQQHFDPDATASMATVSVNYTDENENVGPIQRFYTIYTVDIYGNISEENVHTLMVYTKESE